MSRVKFFDDWKSYVHFFFGILYGLSIILVRTFSFWIWVLILVYMGFIGYEAWESRDTLEFIGDVSEFNLGLIIGGVVSLVLILNM